MEGFIFIKSTTVSRTIIFYWESDLLEKGAICSQINVTTGLLV
jgi:hypothetical protein